MNDDELKSLWQRQSLRNPSVSPHQLLSAMQTHASQVRRIVDARDHRELAACAIVCVIFGVFYFAVHRTPISRLGDLIVIGSSVFIAWKLIYTRRVTPPAPPGATVLESLRAELRAVRAQLRLLGSVLWWYLIPLGAGILVCTWGDPGATFAANFGNIVYTIFVIALFAFIYWLNQRARANQLLPVQAQLEALIRSAETGEPLKESQVANLRPIVLSMAAADKVKPMEFKLALWQIALYGVPGIVGIWFFWVLDRTLSDDTWKMKQPATEIHAPKAPVGTGGDTNRFQAVALHLIDLFNAGDYAAVHALYNQGMSKAFPLPETIDFYTRLSANFGKIEKLDGPASDGYRDWTAFRLDCQRGTLTMSLALDESGKISGIMFKPASIRYPIRPNIIPFLRRFFSGQHLLWGALSFLGGLAYSWLIQRIAGRVLGISILGIHLNKGHNLFLWDDIKDIRTFRFLNVRNLTLVTESGEKALMHWTPLERHRDLKAAVERFAPANHPVRSYLPLLRVG